MGGGSARTDFRVLDPSREDSHEVLDVLLDLFVLVRAGLRAKGVHRHVGCDKLLETLCCSKVDRHSVLIRRILSKLVGR